MTPNLTDEEKEELKEEIMLLLTEAQHHLKNGGYHEAANRIQRGEKKAQLLNALTLTDPLHDR